MRRTRQSGGDTRKKQARQNLSAERSEPTRSTILGTRLLALFSVTLAGVSGATLVPPSLPAMAQAMGIPPSTAALVLAVYTLPGVAVAPVIGFFADRLGRKAVMLPALLLHGIGGGMCTFAGDFKTLLLFRFLQGLGSAGLVNLVVVTLGDLLEGIPRAKYIGYNAAVLTTGTTTFPVVGGILASKNWRFAYAPFWVVLLIAAAISVALPNTKGSVHDNSPSNSFPSKESYAQTNKGGIFSNLAEVLAVPSVRRLMVRGFVLFFIIYGAILASIPVVLEQSFHARPATIGVFLTAGSVASTVMSSLGGRLRQRLSPSRILLIAFSTYTVAMVVLAVASTASSRLVVLLGIAAAGVAEGMSIVVLQTRATEVAPPGLRGTSVAMFVSSARLGQSTGPVAAKFGLDWLGPTGSFLGFAAVAAAISAQQLRRDRDANLERADEKKKRANHG